MPGLYRISNRFLSTLFFNFNLFLFFIFVFILFYFMLFLRKQLLFKSQRQFNGKSARLLEHFNASRWTRRCD